jgi:hypothetical protein
MRTRSNKKQFKNIKTKRKRVFGPSDFVAGDGMLTAVWGPPMWHFLHTMSFNYPVSPTIEQKRHYRDFVLNLENVLPCKYCRMNLTKNFKALPLTMAHMKDRDSFSRYVYELHELVNRMLKKKSNLTYCDVRERYEHFRARCFVGDVNKEKGLKLEKGPQEKGPQEKGPQEKGPQEKGPQEKGCTEPLHGKKSKCVLSIVPKEKDIETFQVDDKCIRHK